MDPGFIKRPKLDQDNDNSSSSAGGDDPMQVDQASACPDMKSRYMVLVVSQESVAGTSNVPPAAAAAVTVDDQLPQVMNEMRLRDEPNPNRDEDKVCCFFY